MGDRAGRMFQMSLHGVSKYVFGECRIIFRRVRDLEGKRSWTFFQKGPRPRAKKVQDLFSPEPGERPRQGAEQVTPPSGRGHLYDSPRSKTLGMRLVTIPDPAPAGGVAYSVPDGAVGVLSTAAIPRLRPLTRSLPKA